MAGDIKGKTQNWFTINSKLSKTVAAVTDTDSSKLSAVAFNVDVMLTIDTLPEPFSLLAYQPMGIDTATSTISIDTDAFMFAMGR